MVKFSKCHAEFKKAADGDDEELNYYAESFECNKLPDSEQKCTSIGLPPVLDKDDKCYAGEGIGKYSLYVYIKCKRSCACTWEISDFMLLVKKRA